jgi:hypothetical protein
LPNQDQASMLRTSIAGFLTWAVPGLGHIYLGHRGRGLVLLVAITATFWSGVAIGGVRETVDPQKRKLWFTAQLCTGGQTIAALALHRSLDRAGAPNPAGHWLTTDIGVHYTGVAGLLNLLVILDAIGRADRPGPNGRGKPRAPGAVP